MSGDMYGTLGILAAEINGRAFPTAIMGYSPGQLLSLSNTSTNRQHGVLKKSGPTEFQLITERMTQMQAKVEDQFGNMANQLIDGQNQQNHIATASDALASSLQDALRALNLSQQKHETAIQHNEKQLNILLKNNI